VPQSFSAAVCIEEAGALLTWSIILKNGHRPLILKEDWQQQRAWVEIDHTAIAHNVRQLSNQLAPHTALMAVVKGDGYGHSSIEVAKTVLANGATWLAVATVPEGMELRQGGIEAPILLLGAANSPDQIGLIEKWQLQPTIVSVEQAQQFQAYLTQPISVHLKIDTGMSRLGTNWQEAATYCQFVQSLSKLQIASIYSHLATADELDETVLKQQHERFEAAITAIRPLFTAMPMLHLANSAGLLVGQNLHYDLVRPGLALYGYAPALHLAGNIDLRPALGVKARIIQIKQISAGTGVSYGHRFVTDRDTLLAVVGIGYADGVPRLLSQKIDVLWQGQRVRQIGNITMDQIMLNITGLDAQTGDVVTLLGQDRDERITADHWAKILGTISWEILCGFKPRLPRLSVTANLAQYE
jgi:alanine racemase